MPAGIQALLGARDDERPRCALCGCDVAKRRCFLSDVAVILCDYDNLEVTRAATLKIRPVSSFDELEQMFDAA